MDLKLAITVLAIAAIVTGEPVPPGGPKYVPVFVSSDALNQLNEKEGQNTQAQINESGQDKGPSENQNILYGPPAPVYEHQPDQNNPSYAPQSGYQNNQQPQLQTQYQQPQIQPHYQQPQIQPLQYQQPIQSQQQQVQPYPINQQPQLQTYAVQQPVQNQQPSQLQQHQIQPPSTQYQIAQQPAQQAIVVTQQNSQPLYGNQQQILQQPLGQQITNQQPLYSQQLVSQPIQSYQQPNQLLIRQPATNQQILTQQSQPILISQQTPLPNQQAILVQQPNQNGQTLITSNLVQPSIQNPGYIQNQNQNMYAVVPINGQNLAANQNVGTNTYLVPVQQAPNQVFAVNSG